MPKFRKKPIVIDAIQLTKESFGEVLAFIDKDSLGDSYDGADGLCWVNINTLEGVMSATQNSWVIKGVKGEFYPCTPGVFKESYEEVIDGGGKNS